mmetsp:Transcript_21881/g.46033  ORF Transcript_21881/g.46033 Transcript_21881/m.46033 type:complete len:89 (-) Transcript_21881:70-336(-)
MARDMERAERDLLSVFVELTGSQGGREARRGGVRNMVDCVGGAARARLPWEGVSMVLVLDSYSRRLFAGSDDWTRMYPTQNGDCHEDN